MHFCEEPNCRRQFAVNHGCYDHQYRDGWNLGAKAANKGIPVEQLPEWKAGLRRPALQSSTVQKENKKPGQKGEKKASYLMGVFSRSQKYGGAKKSKKT